MKSRPSYKVQQTPEFSALSEDQILEIHFATLEVLERTGVIVRHEEALDLLRDAGCRISGENRVRIPSWLVEEAIRTAPSRVALSDRNGRRLHFLFGERFAR